MEEKWTKKPEDFRYILTTELKQHQLMKWNELALRLDINNNGQH